MILIRHKVGVGYSGYSVQRWRRELYSDILDDNLDDMTCHDEKLQS